MISINPDAGEVHGELTAAQPAISYPVHIPVAGHYSFWSSLANGTIRVYNENDLHVPIVKQTQEVSLDLQPGNYIVALGGQPGKFTLNVVTVHPHAKTETPVDESHA